MAKVKPRIYFQVRLKKAQRVDGKNYRKGFLLADGLTERELKEGMDDGAWEDVIGHGNSNYFDNEEVYVVKVEERKTVKRKRIKL